MSETLLILFGANPVAALFVALLRINLAMSAALLLVVALRAPVRRAHGPSAAYYLWWAPVVVGVFTGFSDFLTSAPDPAVMALAGRPNLLLGLEMVWGLGAATLASAFTLAQARFQAQVRAGRAGPAVVGLVAPRIVFPRDDGAFSQQERELIRAHEREHIARKDPRGVALATLLQCLCWFNPLVHFAASLLRLDQELACDAAVVLRHPGLRGLYARTLLKGQMMVRSPPLSCCWLAHGVHPLELRIAQLKRRGSARAHGAVHAMGDAIRP